MGIAQGVASLVVDDVAPVCPQVTGVSVCAELPAPGIEDDVPAVAARQPTARVERCAEFIGRLWGGQDDPEVGMAIDADERVSRRPAAPITETTTAPRPTKDSRPVRSPPRRPHQTTDVLLRNLGLVDGERSGRNISYTLYDDHVVELLEQAIYHAEHVRIGATDRRA